MKRERAGAAILQVVAVIFAVMAVFIGVANQSELFKSLFEGDFVAGSLGVAHRGVDIGPFKAYVYGVLGGTMIGFSALVFAAARFGIARRQKWAWWAVLGSSLLWYSIDTGASMGTGVFVNAAGNTVFLGIILAALALSARPCLGKADDAGSA